MARFEDVIQLISKCHYRIAEDRAALQRLAREPSYTHYVIERATLAYHVSLWTLEKIERSQSISHLNAASSPPEPSDS
jgi:hypothetical protein